MVLSKPNVTIVQTKSTKLEQNVARRCPAILMDTGNYSVQGGTPSVMIPTIGHLLTLLQNTGTPTIALDHVMNLDMVVMPALTRNIITV